jgi:membrane-bound hydrogenase subunit mbhJ
MFKKMIDNSTGKSPWLFHINAGSCNGCDIELVAVLTPRYDAERLGFKLTGTPRHADIVVVTGPVTAQTKDRVLRTIAQVPDPKVIVTLGSCPRSCNVFKGSYSVVGPLDKYVLSMCPSPLRSQAGGNHRRSRRGREYSQRKEDEHQMKLPFVKEAMTQFSRNPARECIQLFQRGL